MCTSYCCFFFVKQKTAYEMRISDWSSDVCSSDLPQSFAPPPMARAEPAHAPVPQTASYPLGVARGQVRNTYIVAEADDGLVIVDQHAAHERLVLDRMRGAMAAGGVSPQALLLPEVVVLDAAACDRLEARAEDGSGHV